MRLKSYLTEVELLPQYEEQWAKIVPILEKECKQMIALNKRTGKLMYRGTSNAESFEVRVPRNDRKPRDMNPTLSGILDTLTKEKYGWKSRSEGIFCTSNFNDAHFYSRPRNISGIKIVFPVDGWKYIWNKEYEDSMGVMDGGTINNLIVGWINKKDENMEKFVKETGYDENTHQSPTRFLIYFFHEHHKLSFIGEVLRGYFPKMGFTDSNIEDAMKNGHEIIIKCDKYYALSYNIWGAKVEEWLNL